MAEIRMLNLHFTAQEADALIQRVASVQLSPHDPKDLVRGLEGRAYRVVPGGSSLRNHPAPHEFIRDFTGGHRYIVDFLAEEVVGQQPDHIRQFLSRRLSAGSRRRSRRGRRNVGCLGDSRRTRTRERFLIALDDHRQWFPLLAFTACSAAGPAGPRRTRRAPGLHRASQRLVPAARVGRRGGGPRAQGGGCDPLGEPHRRALVPVFDAGRMATVQGWLHSLGDERWIGAHSRPRTPRPGPRPCAGTARVSGSGSRSSRQAGTRDRCPMACDRCGPPPRSSTASSGSAGSRRCAGRQRSPWNWKPNPVSPWYALARAGYGTALYFCGEPEAAARQLEQALLSGSSIALVRMLSFAMMSLVAVQPGRTARPGGTAGIFGPGHRGRRRARAERVPAGFRRRSGRGGGPGRSGSL